MDELIISRALLVDVLCDLVRREYDAERYHLFVEGCGNVEEDAQGYAQIAEDTHAQLRALEARVGIALDHSWIEATAPEG